MRRPGAVPAYGGLCDTTSCRFHREATCDLQAGHHDAALRIVPDPPSVCPICTQASCGCEPVAEHWPEVRSVLAPWSEAFAANA